MAALASLIERGRRQVHAVAAIRRRERARRAWLRSRHDDSPRFRDAIAADVAVHLRFRGEGREHLSRTELAVEALRLATTTDAFLAQVLYRGKVAALRRGLPVVPRLCHLGATTLGGVYIGDPVVVQAGLYLPHGQVVVDGITEVGAEVILFPWTTVGLRGGNFQGPRVGDGVHVFTGAKVLGAIEVGPRARLGANAVVLGDVRPDATVVGVPGREVTGGRPPAP